VVVVDDHRTFAELLTMGLEAHPRLTCVGSASDARSALTLVAREQPDVVVMDIRLGADSGVEVTAQLIERWPHTAVVVLTAFPTPRLMSDVVRAGASALLPKDGALDDLLDTVLSAQPRLFTMPPRLAETMMKPRDDDPVSPLTPREKDVLQQLALGRDVRAISRELGISVNTCRSYVKSVLAKLDVHSQLEAVVAAHQRGILDTGPTG
jgi:DNA-binding NarL/FixJ family response regulator